MECDDGMLSAQEEADQYGEAELENANLAAGDTAYLCSTKWFNAWKAYSGYGDYSGGNIEHGQQEDSVAVPTRAPRPGPIDNTDIVCTTTSNANAPTEIDSRAVENVQYVVITAAAWKKLHSWYGGGPELARPVVLEGSVTTKPVVAVHSCRLTVHYKDNQQVILVPNKSTMSMLKQHAVRAMGADLDASQLHMWDYHGRKKNARLDTPTMLDADLEKAMILNKQDILLVGDSDDEEDTEEHTSLTNLLTSTPASSSLNTLPAYRSSYAPLGAPRATTSMTTNTYGAQDTVVPAPGKAPGLAGLGNLGNTCFMNSSLQCLSHTVPLLRVFLSDAYTRDINRDNPLGLQGKLAEAFGALLQKQWKGGVSVVTPRGFKYQLASFAPQFAGYSQQDSQELLAFLLDGLHEDLNRIRKKPYIEEKDADGRPDEVVAQEAWDNYRARNDSVVVDHFQGLYKSTLVCPQCNYRSVKFDPFMYLSLPLPSTKTCNVEVTVIHMDGSALPTQYAVKLPKNGTIGDLYAAVAKVLHIPTDPSQSLLLAEVGEHTPLTPLIRMDEAVSMLRRYTTVVAYYYSADAPCGPSTTRKEVHVFNRRPKRSAYSSVRRSELFAAPLVVWLEQEALEGMQQHTRKQPGGYTEFIIDAPGALGDAVHVALRPFKRQRMEDPPTHTSPHACSPAHDLPNGTSEDKENRDTNTPPGAVRPAPPDTTIHTTDPMDTTHTAPLGQLRGEGSTPMHTPARGGDGASVGGGSDRASCASDVGDVERMEDVEGGMDDDGVQEQAAGGGEEEGVGGGECVRGLQKGFVPLEGFVPQPGNPLSLEDTDPPAPPSPEYGPMNNNSNGYRPFSMFDKEEEEEEEEEESNGGAFVIKRTSPGGDTHFWSEGERHGTYFAIDWCKDAEEQYDLTAMTDPIKDPSIAAAEAEASSPSSITLDQCLQAFTTPEQLDAADSWYCSKCKEHVRADKKLDLWTLPEVLVVHLKRFSYSRLWRDKLDATVDFPLEGLDLCEYVLQDQQPGAAAPVYDLFAVSNHYGGLGGGHYTAYCRMPDNGRWYCFDDSHVSEISTETVLSSAAYVLFYRRRDQHIKDQGVQLQSTVDIADEQPTNSHSPPPTTTTALMPAISIPALPSTHLDNTLPALPSLLDNNSSGASSAAVSPMAAEGPEREPQVVGGTDMRVVADGGQHTVAWNGVEHQQEGGGEGDDEGDDMMQ